MYFGKYFTYEPNIHTFSEIDREIIDKLIEIWDTESFYTGSEDFLFNSTPKQRSLMIPTYAADELLAKLQHSKCKYVQQGNTYKQLYISEEVLPFTFDVNKNSPDEYKLKISGAKNGYYYSRYGWYGRNGVLYKLSDTQKRTLRPFSAYLNEGREVNIPISGAQVSKFITKTIPKIKQIGEVSLSKSIEAGVTSPPLNIKAYVDKQDEIFTVNVEYHYDSTVINPVNDEEIDADNDDKILIRDDEKENEFMHILEQSTLKVGKGQLYADTEEDQYSLLYYSLPEMDELAEIFMTSRVKSMVFDMPPQPEVDVDASADGGYLDIGFKMEGINPEDIFKILQSVREKKKYYKLPDGSFLPLDDSELHDIAELHGEFSDYSNSDESTLQLPLYRGLQVEDRISGVNEQTKKFNEDFKEMFQSVRSPEHEESSLPDALQADLREYQKTGFKWLKSLSKYSLGGILADDMGLGKTLQCIAYLLSEKEEGVKHPSLIVVPASLTYNWKIEFHKFSPDLEIDVLSGSVKERRQLMAQDRAPDVYITSYHTLRQDLTWYKNQTFHAMILDEAQAIKNHRTKIAQAVREVKSSKRFALSGTPIENSQDELWSIFQAIMPGFLYDYKSFRSMQPDTIARIVKPFIMRRLKEDVLSELPDKIETVQYSELNQEQKTLYLGYLEKIQSEAKTSLETEGLNKGRIKILAGLTRLRQLCCHPSLFIDQYDGGSGKLDSLFEIIENARENNQRILLFSQFPSMLKIIQEQLASSGRSCFYLDGQTPSKERVQLVEAFNKGEENLFLISLKAGGTGLNLTGADTVVLYDLWWNPAIEEQAIGRAHRIGQKSTVQVIRMITQGTIEEKINELHHKKKEMIDQIIQPGESSISSMTEDDIREILSI